MCVWWYAFRLFANVFHVLFMFKLPDTNDAFRAYRSNMELSHPILLFTRQGNNLIECYSDKAIDKHEMLV